MTSTDLKRCMITEEVGDAVVGQHGEAVVIEESVMAVVVGHKRVQAVLSHELEQHECERERVDRGE